MFNVFNYSDIINLSKCYIRYQYFVYCDSKKKNTVAGNIQYRWLCISYERSVLGYNFFTKKLVVIY